MRDSLVDDCQLVGFSSARSYPGRYRAAFHERTAEYVSGRVLDLGAGGGPTADRWGTGANEVVAVDVDAYDGLDARADGAALPFAAATFDTVVCSAVFEHVSLPRLPRLFEEVQRVLRPGGHLVAAVAFQYPLHGQPADYCRPTVWGLDAAARDVGLETETLYRGGSYVDTLLHVLYSPLRRAAMYAGARWLSRLFAAVHYPVLGTARLVGRLFDRVLGRNPWGSRWYLTSGMVARCPPS